jgi:hypothetical protein
MKVTSLKTIVQTTIDLPITLPFFHFSPALASLALYFSVELLALVFFGLISSMPSWHHGACQQQKLL